jgi:V-type H+-transporting ATPase subunit a
VQQLEALEKWRLFFWKERYLYDCLNKMEARGQFYIAELYVPAKNVPALTHILSMITPTPTLQSIEVNKPPTAFNTNSFTNIAQQITDTYGIPRYQEVNPSIFTCVTFPFFFGVMFGDMAHGGVLFLVGLFLVFWDEQIKRSPLKAASDLRYMVAMMGFFAFYCGWIYNDFMGYNLNIFGSCYNPPLPPSDDEKGSSTLEPQKPLSDECMYPFGIDPIWGRA